MTAHQLRAVLAEASNRASAYAAKWGTRSSDRHYRAWLWVTAQTLDQPACIPGRGYWESWELEEIRQTIQRVADLVPLDDNC